MPCVFTFGVITADGKVYPCEILEDKLIGDLRKNDMDFMKIWLSQNNKNIKRNISRLYIEYRAK